MQYSLETMFYLALDFFMIEQHLLTGPPKVTNSLTIQTCGQQIGVIMNDCQTIPSCKIHDTGMRQNAGTLVLTPVHPIPTLP